MNLSIRTMRFGRSFKTFGDTFGRGLHRMEREGAGAQHLGCVSGVH